MKRFLIGLALVLLPCVCLAGANSQKIEVVGATSNAVKAVTSTYKFSGYLESIYIDVTAPATQTVVVATSTETLLTATAVTADTLYRVRYPAVTSAGVAITSTNIACLLVQEPITVTVTSTQPLASTVGATIKFYNVK